MDLRVFFYMKEWIAKKLDIEGVLSKGLVVEWEDLYVDYLLVDKSITSSEFRDQIDEIVSDIVGVNDYVIVTDFYIFSVSEMEFRLYQVCDKYAQEVGMSFVLVDIASEINNEYPTLRKNIGRTFKNDIENYFVLCRRCVVTKNLQGSKRFSPGPYTKKIKKVSFIKNKIKQ